MRLVVPCIVISVCLASSVHAQATLLQQTQAADLLSGLLTLYGDLTTSRRDAMRAYLAHTGRLREYEANRPAAPPRHDVAFADAYAGALLFVQRHGTGMADGALARMPAQVLRQEFAALQHYNLEQFVDLNRKRDEIGSMKAFLDRRESFDEYMRWAEATLDVAPEPANRPTTQTAQGFADWIAQQAGSFKAQAWERAQAKGIARDEFEKQWRQKLAEMRQQMDRRIATMRELAIQLQHGERSERRTTYRPVPVPPPNQTPPAFAATPVDPADPRWTPHYYGPARQFNSWVDPYPDVYQRRGVPQL